MNTSITDDLIALIVRELKITTIQITPTTPLFENGLDLDSFAIVDLVSRMESHFGFQLQDDDFMPDNFVDIQKLSDLVARYVATKA